ncbi:hypothetical protein T4B_7093 [Trichinella pseudospiralis]|uniref:Uncharacterized protein n=1 Tax=Trichinella pseudospiralis TaxID=6337 RepID=A0A0V1IPX4_TRIPS|nr:hypothetical protein T4B_7093 [Trichinella pseudospiralis]
MAEFSKVIRNELQYLANLIPGYDILAIPLPIRVWNVLIMNKMQPAVKSTSLMSNQLINKLIPQKESIEAEKYFCNCNKSELHTFQHDTLQTQVHA